MTINYFTIMLNQVEHMQIDIAAAGQTSLRPAETNGREAVYDCHRLFYVAGGRGILQSQNREIALQPGVLVVQLSGTPHAIILENGTELTLQWCHFHASYGDREIFNTLQIPFHVIVAESEDVYGKFGKLIEAVSSKRGATRIRAKGIMLDLIGLYLEHLPEGVTNPQDVEEVRKIDLVLKYIDDHLAENMTVEELARQVYLHPNYFIVFFKNLLGSSPIQYVNQRRMELAKSLLALPEGSVSNVADRVGMAIYYFSRMFKAHTGLTPSRYRKLALSNSSAAPEIVEGGASET